MLSLNKSPRMHWAHRECYMGITHHLRPSIVIIIKVMQLTALDWAHIRARGWHRRLDATQSVREGRSFYFKIRHTKTAGIQGSTPTLTAVPGGMYGAAWIRGVLAAGQTAHLAMLGARLVHEGAVEAGPHS